MELYKIRRPSDEKFFSGSGYKKSTWTSNGKSYNSIPLVRNAIRTSIRGGTGTWDDKIDPTDIEIVEYTVQESRVLSLNEIGMENNE